MKQQMNDYNIARVFALYKSYWAAMNKIYIYEPPSVNEMTWAFFFTWLQSFRPVKLQCTFPSLWNMEETSEEPAKKTLQQDRSQYNLSKFFLQTMSYMCAIIDPLSSWTFHFLAGEICMIEAKKAKKKLSDCISVWHVTLILLMMDLSIQKWTSCSVYHETSGFNVHLF